MGEMTAKEVYYNYRIYQHYLIENHLVDDSNSITVKELQSYIKDCIDIESYERLKSFCLNAY